MHLTVVSGSVSAVQSIPDNGLTRPATWFRINNHPARMKHARTIIFTSQPTPVVERDQVTACGVRKHDFLLVFALYNHTTGVMGRLPVGQQAAGCILIGLMGVFLVSLDSDAAKAIGLVLLAAAGFTAWHIRRITKAARLIWQHIRPPG